MGEGHCINRFLKKEIELLNNPTIITLGKDSFKYCALSFPDHFIIGIPHPNARGDFTNLEKRIEKNKGRFLSQIADAKDNNGNYKALNLKNIN